MLFEIHINRVALSILYHKIICETSTKQKSQQQQQQQQQQQNQEEVTKDKPSINRKVNKKDEFFFGNTLYFTSFDLW